MKEGSGFEDVPAWGLGSSASTSSYVRLLELTKLPVRTDEDNMRRPLLCSAGEENHGADHFRRRIRADEKDLFQREDGKWKIRLLVSLVLVA
jgi:hypothetical protein